MLGTPYWSMTLSLLHLVGLRPRVYYTLINFRGGGQGPLGPPPQYANAHTDKHVKSAPPPHINPVKQYTKFKVGGHFSFVVKISLHTPFCGCCGKCSIEKKLIKMDFGAFCCIFYITLP